MWRFFFWPRRDCGSVHAHHGSPITLHTRAHCPFLRIQEESRTTLGRLRDEKKAWFETRRKNGTRTGGALVDNDRDTALSVVECVVKLAAAGASGRADWSVSPSSGPPPPPTKGSPGCPFANDAVVSPSVSRRIAHAGSSPAEGGRGSRGKEGTTVDELRGAVTGPSMSGPEGLEMRQEEEEDEL